jgi:hypothetical protein
MKYVLAAMSLLIGTQAFAKTHTELADQCLSAVEQAITDTGDYTGDEAKWNEATVSEIYLAKKGYVELSYSRYSEDSQITGEAAITLKVFKFTRNGDNVTISGCKVEKAEILDERAD